jgi:general stress protein 26
MASGRERNDSAGEVSTEKKVDDLFRLVEGIEVAMFTTRRADGQLVSRPMQLQGRSDGADLWFVTDAETHKLDELESDPHVNLAFYRDRTREWVSVSGRARVVSDRGKVRELYKPDWRAWFTDEGGARDGGPEDPRITLVAVDADSVVYMRSDTPRPVVLFEVMKGIVTGERPDIGEVRRVSGAELHGGGAKAAGG